MMDTKTYADVCVFVTLPQDLVLGPEPGHQVFGCFVYASFMPGYSEQPWVSARGWRVNVDGNVGKLWQNMDIPWESLPANLRHRLAHAMRAKLREASHA